MAKQLTKQNFEQEVIRAEGKVLVDFWAPWCAPCRMQAPVVDKMAEDGYHMAKVNIDEEMELASQYKVMTIPTLIVFKDGQEIERFEGVQSRNVLEASMN